MSRLKNFAKHKTWCIMAFFLLGCSTWFEYSPYDARVDESYRGTTEQNLRLVEAIDAQDSKSFNVALLSDPHYHFRKLDDAIAHINAQGDYAFAIVTGDLTENGLKREFVLFYNAMSRLKIPYLTTIGNHDYLSNGEKIYEQMFGPASYTFVYNHVKFVLFDNVTLESGQQPDMEWFSAALRDGWIYDHVIPLSHIPPYDIQMQAYRDQYHELMVNNKIGLSLHGHRHDFSDEDVYGDGIHYVTISSPQKRTYTRLTVSATDLEVKMIEY